MIFMVIMMMRRRGMKIMEAMVFRPICVAEGESLSEKSSSSLAYWWATTFLKVVIR